MMSIIWTVRMTRRISNQQYWEEGPHRSYCCNACDFHTKISCIELTVFSQRVPLAFHTNSGTVLRESTCALSWSHLNRNIAFELDMNACMVDYTHAPIFYAFWPAKCSYTVGVTGFLGLFIVWCSKEHKKIATFRKLELLSWEMRETCLWGPLEEANPSHWKLSLSDGPNAVNVSNPSPEDGNRWRFRNATFFYVL
jgi:hypothetical protein